MEPRPMLSPIIKLTSPLLTTDKNSPASIDRLFKALQESNINLSGVTFFKNEEEVISSAHQERASLGSRVGEQVTDGKQYNVFRREVPVLSSRVKGSVPEWAHGASPLFTLGPFLSQDGRRFWFDFYSI